MKIINRIYQYIDYRGIKPTRFEKQLGLSNGYLGTQLKRNADLGESVINKIIDNCLDLNSEWLITGRGNMLIDSFEENMIKEPQVFYQKKEKEVESERIQELKETIATQRDFIDFLKRKIDRLEDAQGAEVADAG